MTNKKTVTMTDESSIWGLDMVDPVVGTDYENLRVATAEIIKEDGDTRLRIELRAEVEQHE